MAEENKKTGPNTEQNRQIVSDIKDVKKEQGDFNDILKESINLLKKIDTSYENIKARINSLNKDQINLKQINNEIYKAKQKESITTDKLAKAQKELSQQQKNNVNTYFSSTQKISELEIRRFEYQKNALKAASAQERAMYLDKANQVDEILGYEIARNERIKSGLDVQEAQVIALKQANKIAKEGVAFGEERLEAEKRINDSVGISGRLMGILGKKLGANNDVYGDMVKTARELDEVGAKLTFFDKFKFLTKSVTSSAWSSIKDPFVAIPAVGGAIAGVIGLLKQGFDYIVGIQDKTVKFARAMNISTVEARKIKMEFASLSVSSGDIFINSQKMVESQMEMVDALGVTNRMSNEILATNIKLKDIAGLDLETRKGIAETATITGQESEALTKSILAQVVGLKQATGIQFQNQKILKEAASQSGYLGLQFAKYPAQLTKSLLTVKAMGLELKQLDSMADSFLDFESSISKEFEAQLLTGKEINLSKARELFLNNDLAGAAAEITSQVGSAGDFLKLNRIQADSLASAFGMSRDQMGEMLKQQELLAKLGARQGDSARDQLRLGLERYKNQKALSAAIGEEAYQNLVNASMQEKIAAFIEKVKQSLSDFVENSGIIDKIEQFVKFLSEPENIRRVVIMIRDVFAQIVDIVASISSGIIGLLDTFGFISDQKAASAQAFLSGAGNRIRSLGGDFGGPSVSDNAAKGATSGQNMSTSDSGGNTKSNTMGTPVVYKSVLQSSTDNTFSEITSVFSNSSSG